jgi:histidine kinase
MVNTSIWRRLRWRLLGAQLLVVIVGVVVLALAAQVAVLSPLPNEISEILGPLIQSGNEDVVDQVGMQVVDTVRKDVLWALAIAAVSAAVAGLVASIVLMREILRPLHEIAQSSRRIAHGHYDERVDVPASDELAEVATHFNQMAAALEAVEEQRVLLLGNVAHELRTPLTGVKGYVEGLMDGLFHGDEDTYAMIDHEIRRMQRLIDDIQALSRVEAGQIELQSQRMDLIPVVERCVAQIRPMAETACLRIEADVPQQPYWVQADPDRFAQIILNLLSNAVRYTPEGGCIVVRLHQNDEIVEIAVEDDGIGIPADALPHLFERFYRVDPSRTRASGGSGIGLTISRHLAWAMGGDLTAASPGPDQGSTFVLSLPGRAVSR